MGRDRCPRHLTINVSACLVMLDRPIVLLRNIAALTPGGNWTVHSDCAMPWGFIWLCYGCFLSVSRWCRLPGVWEDICSCRTVQDFKKRHRSAHMYPQVCAVARPLTLAGNCRAYGGHNFGQNHLSAEVAWGHHYFWSTASAEWKDLKS